MFVFFPVSHLFFFVFSHNLVWSNSVKDRMAASRLVGVGSVSVCNSLSVSISLTLSFSIWG